MTPDIQTTPPPEETRERSRAFFAGPFAPVYSFYMEHEPLSKVVARLVWGADIRPFYASMEAVGRMPDGSTIVDVPCGAGVAFRGLLAEQQLRYVAVDLSPEMLERARRHAAKRSLSQIAFMEGDAEALPFEDGSVDLFMSYWGLHCFADPEAAIAEAHRCLRAGGELVGGMVTQGRSLRQRLLVRPHHGAFARVGTADDLRRWIEGRFDQTRVEVSGAFAYFSATKPDSI